MQKTMASLIFMWLLPLTAGSTVTSALPNNSTNMTTDQLTTQMSILEQTSESLGLKVTTSDTEDVNPTNYTSRSDTSLQTTQTPPATTTKNNQTAATLLSFSQTDLSSSTEKKNTQKSVTMFLTSQTSGKTISSTVPLVQTLSAQSPEKLSASKKTSLSVPTSQSVSFSSAATSTIPDTSTSSHPVTPSSGSYKTTAGRTFTYISEAKDKDKILGNQTNSGKVVGGVIGGALCLMMVGFLVIYIKKNRLQKQQLTATDWAGPSPFLESDNENGKVTLRTSNRISLSSFLPQRLSKRLSLLPERDEELQDMTPGATFGGKHLEGISGQSANGKNVQEQTGSVVVDSEEKNKGQCAETSENCVSESSTKNSSNHSEAADLN